MSSTRTHGTTVLLMALAGAAWSGAIAPRAQATIVALNCFPLENTQVVPPSSSLAVGGGNCTLDTTTNLFTWNIDWDHIVAVSQSFHFHSAPAGMVGPIVLSLTALNASSGSATVTSTQAADILAGNWYYDIHTFGFSAGELRGQVVPTGCALQVFHHFPLSGAQVVPASGSTATGTGIVVLEPYSNHVYWSVGYSGLSGPPTAIHVHGGAAAGSNGLVLYNGNLKNPSTQGLTTTDVLEGDLTSGTWYFDIHTSLYPDGEIRGQIVDSSVPQWSDLGGALGGTFGLPVAIGEGSLQGGSTNMIKTYNGKPGAASILVVGASRIDAPFKGGTMVPLPTYSIGNVFVNSQQHAGLPFTWPTDAVLVGFELYWQQWMADPVAVHGVSASNAVKSTGQ